MKEKRKLSPLAVGDRVAVYAHGQTGRWVGTVTEACEQSIRIGGSAENPHGHWYHRKQCRRLKPKKAPAAPDREDGQDPKHFERIRQEWPIVDWMFHRDSPELKAYKVEVWLDHVNKKPNYLMVELREGERILSRADVERAFDKIGLEKRSDHANIRGELAEALGFSEEREP